MFLIAATTVEEKRVQEADHGWYRNSDRHGSARRTPHPPLREAICSLIHLRRAHPALRRGSCRQFHVAHEQIAFLRATEDEQVVVAVNAAGRGVDLRLALPGVSSGRLIDLLDSKDPIPFTGGVATIRLYRRGTRVLRVERDR